MGGCANGGISGVPAWCGTIEENLKGCVQICKIDSTSACDSTGKGYDWCKTIDKDYWPNIPQCRNGGGGGGGGGIYGGGGGGGGGGGSTNAAPSAGGLVMMATMQGVVGALLLTA